MNLSMIRPAMTQAPRFQAADKSREVPFIRENPTTPLDQVLQFVEASAVSRIKESRSAVLKGASDFMTLESTFNSAPYFVQAFKAGLGKYAQIASVFQGMVDRAGAAFNTEALYPVLKKAVKHIADKDPDADLRTRGKEVAKLFQA